MGNPEEKDFEVMKMELVFLVPVSDSAVMTVVCVSV
jgi:hypothetical protein